MVFADLDGTVLDHHDYSHDVSRKACLRLEQEGAILCFVSSKTKAEIEHFRRLLHNRNPYICENGGAVMIPVEKNGGRVRILALGSPHAKLVSFLKHIRTKHGIRAKGFSEMPVKELARICGLSPRLAKLSKQRLFDEPFILAENQRNRFRAIQRWAKRRGLHCTRGSRFYHILGKSDKGKAVRVLRALLAKRFGRIKTYAVGDSLNDAPMFRAADRAFLVRKHDGIHDWEILRRIKKVEPEQGIGPQGFVRAANAILQED